MQENQICIGLLVGLELLSSYCLRRTNEYLFQLRGLGVGLGVALCK